MLPPDGSSLCARSTPRRPILDFHLAPPSSCAKSPILHQEGDWSQDLTERLLDDEMLHQALSKVLTTMHRDLLGPNPLLPWTPHLGHHSRPAPGGAP